MTNTQHPYAASDSSTNGAAAPPSAGWKLGREFLPFHPDASHIAPDYRDGWNACYAAAADSVARVLPPPGVVAWLKRDGKALMTARQKSSFERDGGECRTHAREHTVPLVPGSLPGADIERVLGRIESAMLYAEATVASGNLADRQREWARVHAGRAGSSERQLRLALQELAQLRALLATQSPVVPQGCTRLAVTTFHPTDYVLTNEADGTSWRGAADGQWGRA